MSSIARPLTRGLPLGWFAAALLLATIAATGAWALTRAGAQDGLGAAREAAERAAAAEEVAAEAAADVAALQRRLEAATGKNATLSGRLERTTETLWASLKRLRTDLAAARTGSREALASVGASAAEARAAAKDLSILEDRFEYHLRADHGGG